MKNRFERIIKREGSEDIQVKVFEIEDFDVKKEDGKIYMTGYANNKNKADRYGDIPVGDNVYDIKLYKKNPVVLIDHWNSSANIAGNMVKIFEDKIGLGFKMLLRNLEDVYNDRVKDAISAYITGFGRALSIGGRWFFDEEKKDHLIKAVIHEISLVGVGADGYALTDTPKPKMYQGSEISEDELEEIKRLEKKYGKEKVKKMLTRIKENKENEEIR